MNELNEIYGAALALPSEVSGILISGTPAPYEAANGIYLETGDTLGGRPVYSNDQGYYISAPEGDDYALYDTVDPLPGGGFELYNLGPDGLGPVTAGQLAEPFPIVQVAGSGSFGISGGLIQGPSTPTPLSQYPSASTLPASPANPVTVPAASSLPTSPENPVSTPAATVLPASSLHPVSNFSSALQPPGFPAYIVPPASPAISIRSGYAAVYIKVQTASGGRFRILNQSTGTNTGYADSMTTLGIALLPNQWNLIVIQAENQNPGDIRNLDINSSSYIAADFVLHFDGHCPRYGTLGGGFMGVRLLDFEVAASATINYWGLGRLGMSANLLDRLLIAFDAGAANPSNGSIAFSNNPGSADALRSPAALAALNSLLQKGWTITR